MQTITRTIAGHEFTFRVTFEHDHGHGAPWEECDGHGIVTGWERRDKRPGELVLSEDRGSRRFYDFAETCRIARRDGWNAAPYRDDETPRQRAAKAARADYEYLRAWCGDDWAYVVVTVTLLDGDGDETDISETLGGVETFRDYHETAAGELADEIMAGHGTAWGAVSRETFGYLPKGAA